MSFSRLTSHQVAIVKCAAGTFKDSKEIQRAVRALERLEELAPPNHSRFNFEVMGYTPQEFIDMLVRLNIKAVEVVEQGIPIISGAFFSELKRKLDELKSRGLRKTSCTYELDRAPISY